MNEDQPFNDHRLHIDPCICGNVSPEVSGDDFDAMVDCAVCGRATAVCYGTRNAIHRWNEGNIRQPEPVHPTDADLIEELREEIRDLRDENERLQEKLDDAHRALSGRCEPDEPYSR